MLRVAICDDNNVFVNKMSQAVKSEFTRQNNEDIELETYVSSELMFQHHLIKPFDVIFLDIDMPELDGFQLAAKISGSNDCYIIDKTEPAAGLAKAAWGAWPREVAIPFSPR